MEPYFYNTAWSFQTKKGRLTAQLHLKIDIEKIIGRLAYRAMTSKGRKSAFMNGAVTVIASGVSLIPEGGAK
jgi:hypothetical protein